MKKSYLILISIACLMISACKSDISNEQTITSDDVGYLIMSWSKIEPKFQKYIENDKELSERDKLSLKNHAKLITETLNK